MMILSLGFDLIIYNNYSIIMRVLNLYAGLGGNRKHWEGCEVTAVELDKKIAKVYQELNPGDTVIVADAHEYLLNHYSEFDFIWSSPPCQSHSQMEIMNKRNRVRYADMSLYEEIILLTHFFSGRWVVENVRPYYGVLMPAMKIGRHYFWSNYHIGKFPEISPGNNFVNNATNVAGAERLKKWLGIEYAGQIYYQGNHNPTQVLANCVHPDLGLHVFEAAKGRDLFEGLI